MYPKPDEIGAHRPRAPALLLSARVSNIVAMTDAGDSPEEGTAGEEPQQPAAPGRDASLPGTSATTLVVGATTPLHPWPTRRPRRL
jgi:hypothetical protein